MRSMWRGADSLIGAPESSGPSPGCARAALAAPGSEVFPARAATGLVRSNTVTSAFSLRVAVSEAAGASSARTPTRVSSRLV